MTLLLIVLALMSGPVAYAEQDYAKDIQQTMADWSKQQLADTVKGIFKIRQDEQSKIDRSNFGEMIIQVGYLMTYGWLVSFMMPEKIAGLLMTTAIMGSVQVFVECIYEWLK